MFLSSDFGRNIRIHGETLGDATVAVFPDFAFTDSTLVVTVPSFKQ
jgi:hypothetical protein